MKFRQISSLFVFLFLIVSCEDNDSISNSTDPIFEGSGLYTFNYTKTNGEINMRIFFHVPLGDVQNMPVLFVFHGASRNPNDYRNEWIAEANEKQVIVVVPEFSNTNFPGGDGYNLGNVFVDGDNPSLATLNPEQDWAFSIIEPLFDDIKSKTGNNSSRYDVFGFSAGSQFAHRFLMFKPEARINQVVASAAGWYTVPDETVTFPYGIADCPIENNTNYDYFSKRMTLQIGTLDNNPNASALRRNDIVDQQGTNRYDRAFYMFNTSQARAQSLGVNFNWEIIETPNNAHNSGQSVPQASDVLYE